MTAREIKCPDCNGEGYLRTNGWPCGPDCQACNGAGHLVAQGIAAPSGGKTGTGLTEGKSPTPTGDAPRTQTGDQHDQ